LNVSPLSPLDVSDIPKSRPVAIVDIGSNSVRLVAFDNLDRSPIPAFNEKTLCALGNGVFSTGRLSKNGMEKALVALKRFRVLIDIMGITEVHVIATAAARDATNGPEFLSAAQDALGGAEVKLLSGQREAKLSAFGVLSGVHDPDGVVGDLGGGSLELIDVKGGAISEGISLPLGGLALMDASQKSPKAAVKIVRDALAKCDALDALQGRTFYAVGGTWRSLAKLHMGQRNYPLLVMHGYSIPAREAAELADLIERVDASSFLAIESVNSARRPLLAYGAVVLDELIRRAKPKDVVISTYGVREGLLYEALAAERRDDDPLLVAVQKLNRLLSRSPAYAKELVAWTSAFLDTAALEESVDERRLREAACYLSEVNWRAHPDYRGVQSFNLVSSAILPGVDHAERSYLSLVATLRYVGLDEEVALQIRNLMPPKMIERASIIGAVMRIGSVLAAGMPGVLPSAPLSGAKGKIQLLLPPRFADLANDRLSNRVKGLAKMMGREFAVGVDPTP
jgi:exopolyphosphatase/guanosine-5'-triphosphate,3'-diphosphate pyrophosphatase